MQAYTLAQLAEHIDAEVHGDENLSVAAVATLASAQPGQIAFLANARYKAQLETTKASAVIVAPGTEVPDHIVAVVTKNPYLGFAKVAQLLDTTPNPAEGVAATAQIAPSAKLGKNVQLGHHVVIEAGAELGDNVIIGAGSYIGAGTVVGANTKIWQRVTIYHNCVIGKECVIHSGVVIGADGFGWATENSKWVKIPQLGRVVIGDRVDIGANTTVDRGALDDTIISSGCIIDNQCQIAHNAFVDEDTAIAGCTVLAGSSHIGKRCLIGGASAINGHIEICDDVQISGFSMVIKGISEPGVYASGIPAAPHREWRRNGARFRQLDDLFNRVKALEKEQKNS